MIKFRQKSFIAPAIGLLARAGSVLSKVGNGSKLMGALNVGSTVADLGNAGANIAQTFKSNNNQQQNKDQKLFAVAPIAQKLTGWDKAMNIANMGQSAAMVGQMVMAPFQARQANKQAEKQAKEAAKQQQIANKQAEQQQIRELKQREKENIRLTKSLNNLAKNANNPGVAEGFGTGFGQQIANKTFSKSGNVVKELGRLGKDLIGNVGSGVKKEAITVKKKNWLGITKNVPVKYPNKAIKYRTVKDSTGIGKVGKTLIGLGTLGVVSAGTGYVVDKAITADARKVGLMPKKKKDKAESDEVEKNYSSLSQVGTYLKKGIKYAGSKENLKGATGMAVFGLLPAVGYVIKRKQYKDQIKEQEKTYSKSMGKLAKKYAIIRHPGQTITGGLAKLTSWGNFGRNEIKAYGKRLIKNSESDLGKKVGKFIVKNPKTSNIIGAGIGAGILAGSYDLGDKLIRKTAKRLDKDAYAYEEYNNQPVEEQ